jgi:hypothetical protein
MSSHFTEENSNSAGVQEMDVESPTLIAIAKINFTRKVMNKETKAYNRMTYAWKQSDVAWSRLIDMWHACIAASDEVTHADETELTLADTAANPLDAATTKVHVAQKRVEKAISLATEADVIGKLTLDAVMKVMASAKNAFHISVSVADAQLAEARAFLAVVKETNERDHMVRAYRKDGIYDSCEE